MSLAAIEWAFRQAIPIPSAKLALLALADHADNHGYCWPSIPRIVERTGLSRATIYRSIDTLTALGVLQLVKRNGGNAYYLAFEIELLAENKPQYVKASIPQGLRTAVYERDMYRCRQCGTHKQLSCDHIIPEVHGGPTSLENLQTLCLPCNKQKYTKLPHDEISESHNEILKSHAEINLHHGETLTVKKHQEPPKKRERAHAISEDWLPDDALLTWASERTPHVDHAIETEKFINYYLSKGDARKDWKASWRNWMLRATRDYSPGPIRLGSRSDQRRARNAERIDAAMARRSGSCVQTGDDDAGLRPVPVLRLVTGGAPVD